MALTNFAALTEEELTVWSRDFWRVARNASFINQFAGNGPNSMVQRITELTKNEKGARAVITLLADMAEDGTTGDFDLEGNEEALRAYDEVVQLDQLRFANRLAGRMADQRSVVTFRETSRDMLAYAMADRIDQLAFLTMSGVTYDYKTNGAKRTVKGSTGQNLTDLEFADTVTAPTANRHLMVTGSTEPGDGGVDAGDPTALTATDTIGYKHIVEVKAFAKDNYIRGLRGAGNQEVYHMFVTPRQMATLKLDPDFLANVRNAGVRGPSNELFAGTTSLMVDGVMVHEFRHVFSTEGGSDAGWGVPGARALFCGAQALAMADIGLPNMVEKTFDYGNQHGIAIDKIFGFLKPVFNSDYTGDDQDFGVIALDTAYGNEYATP